MKTVFEIHAGSKFIQCQWRYQAIRLTLSDSTKQVLSMTIKDYMTVSPVTVNESLEYKSAFSVMRKHEIHHLPVVNNPGELVGIVALRDLSMAARCFKEAPVEISEVMLKPVLTVRMDDSLSSAADLMIEHRIGCLPVLDNQEQLVGMLTETDLFHALRDLLNKAA
jgi:CBS domain-containing protein